MALEDLDIKDLPLKSTAAATDKLAGSEASGAGMTTPAGQFAPVVSGAAVVCAGFITASGNAFNQIGLYFSSLKTSAGAYTLQFSPGSLGTEYVGIICLQGAGSFTTTQNADQLRVSTAAPSGSPADTAFYFAIIKSANPFS